MDSNNSDGSDRLQFIEEQEYTPQSRRPEKGGLTQWLVRKEICKDERQASYFLIVLAIVAIILAFMVPFLLGGTKPKPPVPSINGVYPSQS